jgi:hypothetical protein
MHKILKMEIAKNRLRLSWSIVRSFKYSTSPMMSSAILDRLEQDKSGLGSTSAAPEAPSILGACSNDDWGLLASCNV